MSNYESTFQPYYAGGWENQPSTNTPIMGEALDNIENFLENLDLGGLGGDYALLSEAGYSLSMSVDDNYVLTIQLLNKLGSVMSTKNVDLPLESMFINASYANGVILLTLQNGNNLEVDISDIVVGLVPSTRKIAGIDLEDDISAEELKDAIGIFDETIDAGEIKPWLFPTNGEEVIIGIYGGKPLYRKYVTIEFNIVQNTMRTTKKLSDYVKNVEIIVDTKMYTRANSQLPRLYFDSTNNRDMIAFYVEAASDKIELIYGSSISSTNQTWNLPTIFEYTKTTDEAGSGNNLKPYGIYNAKLDEIKEEIDSLKNATDITETTSTTFDGYAGRLNILEIGGVTEQDKTTGKQLFDYAQLSYQNHISVDKDGFITFTNNTAYGENPIHSYALPKGNYTAFVEVLQNNNCQLFISKTESDYSKVITSVGNQKISFTDAEVFWICVSGKNGASMKFRIMLNEGTEALPYEKYSGGTYAPNPSYPMEIKKTVISDIMTHGKNFLDCGTLVEKVVNGITFTPMYDNGKLLYINVNGTASANASYTLTHGFKFNEDIIVSGCPSSGAEHTYRITIDKYKVKTYLSTTVDSGKGAKISSSECDTLDVYMMIFSGQTLSNVKFYPMIRKASIADATYEPYVDASTITLSQPIELFSEEILTPQKINRNYGVKVFDGTEEYRDSTTTTGGGHYFDINVAGIKKVSNGDSKVGAFCTRLIEKTPNESWTKNTDGFSHPVDNEFLRFRFASLTDITSVDSLKAKLAEWYAEGNPMILVYPLATPTTTELPIADQIALNSLQTFDGTTYVEFDSEIQPTFKAEYGTSKMGGYTLESLLVARNSDLKQELINERISALETSVVNNI